MAGVMLVLMVSILTQESIHAKSSAYRIAHWYRIEHAKIEMLGNTHRHTAYGTPGEPTEGSVSFVDREGRPHEFKGILHPQDQPIHPQMTIPILVDPANPENWTDQLTVDPLASRLIVGFLLLPLILASLAAAWWMRQRILRLWELGSAEQGIVVESRLIASAPLSRAVHCTLQSGRDARLIKVVVPVRNGVHQPGDVLWIIVPRRGVHPALAAAPYFG